MLRLPDPTLVVLVGPSAAGKSTWAGEQFRAEQIVSSDGLRAVVGEGEHDLSASADAFQVLDAIVEARLRRRLTTVVDSLGLDTDRRLAWRDLARRHGAGCVAVAFATSAAECRRRNASREHRVPAAVLGRQLATFTAVHRSLPGEDFDQVIEPQPVRVVLPSVALAAAAADETARSPQGDVAGGSAGGMRFGLHLSSFGVPGGPGALAERLTEVAGAAEAAGFDSLWVMDHFRQIPQLGRTWEDMPESTATLGYLAAATRTASIGCLVNCVTYRNVAHLGKIVATLDVLSSGRARCGLGAGWFEAEHLAYGWPFPPTAHRLDLLEDALRLLPVLWGKGSRQFDGRRVHVPEAMCYPRPLQERIPILVGGSGERRTLRLAAEHADACNLTGEPDRVRHKLAALHRHCAAIGRNPGDIEVTHLSTALVADTPTDLDLEVARLRRPAESTARFAARVNPGTVDDHVLRVQALRDAGVHHVIVSLPGLWDSPAIARFGRVIAAHRGP